MKNINNNTHSISSPRVYFATASFHRAWGEYLFVAEEQNGSWRIFTWSENGWQPMDLMCFNVIYAAAMPRIIVADEHDVDELAPQATSTPVPWVEDGPIDEFSDWEVLLRGYIDAVSRRAAIESIVEHGDVSFTTEDGEELSDSEKRSLLNENMPNAEILDFYDNSEMRQKYLIPPQHTQRERGERVS